MRTIQFLAVAALLAVVVVASPGCKKETPAPSAASVEQKAAQPEAQPAPGSAPAGQGAPADPGTQPAPDKAGSQPAAAGTSGAEAMAPASGGEARPEAVPDNSAAAPSPEAIAPGDTDPATCGDRIAAQEARLRREVLPRLRADQEAAENVAGWVDGTVKELRAEMDTSDRKRQEEHGKEYAACVRELTGARAERDPVCVAYVTSDDTACDRVADLGLRSECRRLVAQKKNGGELRGFGPPASQPVFLDKALLPDMRYEFDPDDPQCTLARAKVVQSPPMGVKGVLFMPMGKPDQSFTQPFMGNGPPTGQGAPPTGQGAPPGGQPGMAPGGALGGQPGMAPGGGPGGQPGGPGAATEGGLRRPNYSPISWKTLDDCEKGTIRLRWGKPLDDAPCRKMIWDKVVLPATEGRTELRLTFVNPFDSAAECLVTVMSRGGESEGTRKTRISFEPSEKKVQSIYFVTEPGTSFEVRPECTWAKTVRTES